MSERSSGMDQFGTKTWRATQDDVIGGWCVVSADDPRSPGEGAKAIAQFLDQGVAEHVAWLHNNRVVQETYNVDLDETVLNHAIEIVWEWLQIDMLAAQGPAELMRLSARRAEAIEATKALVRGQVDAQAYVDEYFRRCQREQEDYEAERGGPAVRVEE